jgi:myo-inositol-1(or 4)-monophosphatase
MNAMLNIALKAARDAGRFIVQSSDRIQDSTIQLKGKSDYVTEIDKRAESHIVSIIHDAYPDHHILAEESGSNGNPNSDFQWIIDPLDGTTNYIHSIPHYAISIALTHKNKLEVALVYDPIKGEEFSAVRGKGAHLNGKRLRVSSQKDLQDAVIGTGFPFRPDQENNMDHYFEQAKRIAKATAGIRRAGAASLDLAYVAAGRLDGFWENGLQPWDMAAGILLIQEAGGMVSDEGGGNDFMKKGNVVCANPRLFKPLLQLLNKKSV